MRASFMWQCPSYVNLCYVFPRRKLKKKTSENSVPSSCFFSQSSRKKYKKVSATSELWSVCWLTHPRKKSAFFVYVFFHPCDQINRKWIRESAWITLWRTRIMSPNSVPVRKPFFTDVFWIIIWWYAQFRFRAMTAQKSVKNLSVGENDMDKRVFLLGKA